MTEFEQRMTDLVTAIQTAAPTRVVTREYKDRAYIDPADLIAGVFTVISRGVKGFSNLPGRMASFGRHQVLVTGQMVIDEETLGRAATGPEVEAAEFAMVAELQATARSSLPESIGGLEMIEFAQSGQHERPHGWVAVKFEIGP